MKPAAPEGRLGAIRRSCSSATNFIGFPEYGSEVRVELGAGAHFGTDGHPRPPIWLLLIIEKNGNGTGGLMNLIRSHSERMKRLEAYRRPVEVIAVSDTVVVSWANGGRQTAKLTFSTGDRFVVGDHFYQHRIDVEGFSGDWIEVDLPSFAFEGNLLTIPRIRFESAHETELAAINC
jgi:hypothetical protein